MRRRNLAVMGLLSAIWILGSAVPASAIPYVADTPFAAAADWLADVRLRNFQTAISSDYEMMIGNSFDASGNTVITSSTITTGHVTAAWAETNRFWITYDPTAGMVSLRLVGSGAQAGGATGGYDVTISRAPDLVGGPVNYIQFELWDRNGFPTFSDGLTLSGLDGTSLGNFGLGAAGIGDWAILDPDGSTLNDGFVLQGSFTLDLTKLDGGREGDKLIFKIGSHPDVSQPVPEPATLLLLGGGLAGLAGLGRRKLQK